MIAIHKSSGFAERWIAYCQQENIDYKIVNCYDSDIIEQLKDCDAQYGRKYRESLDII